MEPQVGVSPTCQSYQDCASILMLQRHNISTSQSLYGESGLSTHADA